MVRRQAANNLAKFIKAMPPSIVIDEMIPLFQHLASDDQDSVRLLTVDILIAIAEAVPKEQQSSHGVLLTALRSLFEDKSWRVRYMVADRFEKVRFRTRQDKAYANASRLQKQSTTRWSTETLSLPLSSFSKTQRPRSAARSQGRFQVYHLSQYYREIGLTSTGFCALLERETLLHDVMPSIEELVSDQSQHVRAALGTQISGLAPILGKEE